jgi:hypothetical protein
MSLGASGLIRLLSNHFLETPTPTKEAVPLPSLEYIFVGTMNRLQEEGLMEPAAFFLNSR